MRITMALMAILAAGCHGTSDGYPWPIHTEGGEALGPSP